MLYFKVYTYKKIYSTKLEVHKSVHMRRSIDFMYVIYY